MKRTSYFTLQLHEGQQALLAKFMVLSSRRTLSEAFDYALEIALKEAQSNVQITRNEIK